MGLSEEEKKKLLQKAQQARQNAYAPYSGYHVGAALMTKSGKIFTGANVENAAYPVTMCAERVALFNAVAAGERAFKALIVATRNGGTPCGSCRQALSEFGLDTRVILVDEGGNLTQETTVGELLPGAFGSGDLEE
jgi:cytidine deaminase